MPSRPMHSHGLSVERAPQLNFIDINVLMYFCVSVMFYSYFYISKRSHKLDIIMWSRDIVV